MSDQIAVVSDIHGNTWALQVVLEDIERKNIQDIVNLGDVLYGPLDPAGTARMLIGLDIPTVRGNEDRMIVEPLEVDDSSTLRYVRESLDAEHLQWLETFEITAVAYEDFFLCHGTPERDNEYLLHEVSATGVSLRTSDELAYKLSSLTQPVLLCGHDHVPNTVYLPDGKLIVNPGSAGMPAYTDDPPFPHAMEAGSPHARYSIVAKNETGWRIENIALPYDWHAAANAALENGRPDWAEWIRTGRAYV